MVSRTGETRRLIDLMSVTSKDRRKTSLYPSVLHSDSCWIADSKKLLGFCIALYDYVPSECNQLTFKVDDVIVLLGKEHDRNGWWKGRLNGKVSRTAENKWKTARRSNAHYTYPMLSHHIRLQVLSPHTHQAPPSQHIAAHNGVCYPQIPGCGKVALMNLPGCG